VQRAGSALGLGVRVAVGGVLMQELLRLAHRGIVEAGKKDNERLWES
jgi:hypothetical protein